DIAVQVEEHRHHADALETLRRDVVNAFDAGDCVLDDIGDVRVHRLGQGGFAVGRDADDGKIDLGELADPHVAVAEITKHDHRGRQHDGEDGIADANVRESHDGSAALRLRVGLAKL